MVISFQATRVTENYTPLSENDATTVLYSYVSASNTEWDSWKTGHFDDVIRIFVTEYLAACESHVLLDTVETSSLDATL